MDRDVEDPLPWNPDEDRYGPKLGPVERILSSAGHLSETPTLEDVRSWASDVAAELDGAPEKVRVLVREGMLEELRGKVSAPAKVVDPYLRDGRPAADDGQGQALALEDPEPWPEDVDGAELLSDLRDTFSRFLALPVGASTALALWTVYAHAHDASPISPVLALTSPEKRCGKTTALELLSALVPRPLPASNLTAAVVFRTVEAWRPTLLVDEADTFLSRGDELRGVLNSGHRRSLAYVPRCVGDEFEVRWFGTWAPKAIALIGELPDTLADRSVEVRMRRRAPDEEVERLRLDRLEELEPLRRQAWTWARAHETALAAAEPTLPDGLHDRERDNWRPLCAIADVAGGPWPDRARKAARALQEGERDDRSLGTRLLSDVHAILEEHDSDRIRSKALVRELCDLEEAPWAEYKGRGLSTVSLANFLRSFDVSSKQIRFPSGSYKGYEASDFEDAFRRYLTPSPSEDPPAKAKHPKQSSNGGGSDGFPRRNTDPDVSARESAENPGTAYDVSGVSGREGGADEGDPLQADLGTSLGGG